MKRYWIYPKPDSNRLVFDAQVCYKWFGTHTEEIIEVIEVGELQKAFEEIASLQQTIRDFKKILQEKLTQL